jgi:hypothetical protein
MYEICALLRQPKIKKARKAAIKSIRVGALVEVHGRTFKVTGRDTRFANAWFVEGAHLSFSRDMIKVIG